MSWGIQTFGPNQNITLSDNTNWFCYSYLGRFVPSNVRQAFSGVTSWITNWRYAYTHTLTIQAAGTVANPPIVFIELPAGSVGDWQNNGGGNLLKMDPGATSNGKTTWTLYFGFSHNTNSLGVRVFERIPQTPSGEPWGMQVRDSNNALLFDSGYHLLWLKIVKPITLSRYSDPSTMSGGNIAPTHYESINMGFSLAGYSVLCTAIVGAYIANSSSGQGMFAKTFQYSGNNLLATWTPTNYVGALGSLTNGSGGYATTILPIKDTPALAAIIDNSNYP